MSVTVSQAVYAGNDALADGVFQNCFDGLCRATCWSLLARSKSTTRLNKASKGNRKFPGRCRKPLRLCMAYDIRCKAYDIFQATSRPKIEAFKFSRYALVRYQVCGATVIC